MKLTIVVFALALFALQADAGILKFTGKAIAKTAKVVVNTSPKEIAKASAKGTKKVAVGVKKVLV